MENLEYILRVSGFSRRLAGLKIERMCVRREEYLNLPPQQFKNRVENAHVMYVKASGKWVSVALSTGQSIMINPGVRGDVRLSESGEKKSGKNIITLKFSDGCELISEMGLFGRFYLATEKELLESKLSFKAGKVIPETSPSYIFKKTALF